MVRVERGSFPTSINEPDPFFLFAILSSAEYRQRLVRQFYGHYLGRAGSDAEISGWASGLQQRSRDEQVLAAILASNEYFQRMHSYP